MQGLFSRAASGIFDSVTDIAFNLPHHLLLSLVYRVVVLHFAARIIPAIRKYSMGYDDGMNGDSRPGFWDGRSLTEEPMVRGCLHPPLSFLSSPFLLFPFFSLPLE